VHKYSYGERFDLPGLLGGRRYRRGNLKIGEGKMNLLLMLRH